MTLSANNPNRKTWLETAKDTDFPIQNIPFGVFLTPDDIITVGSRIGDYAIDLSALHQLGYFKDILLPEDVFLQDSLNDFIALGRNKWRKIRNRIADLFDEENEELQNEEEHLKKVLFSVENIEMQMPVIVGDYTDFYSSKEHAENVGKMFRGEENALLPNWLHMPVAYHGRSSSIIPSGISVRRPKGQKMPKGAEKPVFGPSENVDFELEMAFITTDANVMGESIAVEEAEEHIFGMVIFNDWSARDLQRWEYVPLGPFLAKNFASSISPWVVTLDALEPFRTAGPKVEKEQLTYLKSSGDKTFDINLEVSLKPENGEENLIVQSNFKYLYWNMSQQLAHHSITGCPIRSGDMMGSGTISGKAKNSFGSMLELSWNGENPIKLKDGSERSFIHDNDTIIMRAFSKNEEVKLGFGELTTKLLPASKSKN